MQENMYGVDQRSWLQMTEGDRAQWNQYAAGAGLPVSPMVDPTTLPDYRPDMMYDNYGTIAYAYGGGGSSGVSSSGMGTVGAPNSGGGSGMVGSGYGYAQPGPGLSPLAPGTGQGQGIYNDASAYLGGDFWGGGSDPYAGTQFAGGGNGGGFDPMRGGYVTADAPARGSAEWYGAGYDMIPDGDYSSARDFTGGAGYGGYGGGG